MCNFEEEVVCNFEEVDYSSVALVKVAAVEKRYHIPVQHKNVNRKILPVVEVVQSLVAASNFEEGRNFAKDSRMDRPFDVNDLLRSTLPAQEVRRKVVVDIELLNFAQLEIRDLTLLSVWVWGHARRITEATHTSCDFEAWRWCEIRWKS